MVACGVHGRWRGRIGEGCGDCVGALAGAFEEEVFGSAVGYVGFCGAAESAGGAEGGGEVCEGIGGGGGGVEVFWSGWDFWF